MSQKKFTLETANEFLPQLEQRVKHIVLLRKKIRELQEYYESDEDTGEFDAALLQRELEELYGRLNNHVQFLEEKGVILKDVDKGLADFICEFENRDVLLCWMLGEEKVKYWHETDAGFSGRKPILYMT